MHAVGVVSLCASGVVCRDTVRNNQTHVMPAHKMTLARAGSDVCVPMHHTQGKLETEAFLKSSGVAYTSVRPVYIYGPLNYNPVEEWFFHRIKAGRPIPVPGSGIQVGGSVRKLGWGWTGLVGVKGVAGAEWFFHRIKAGRPIPVPGSGIQVRGSTGSWMQEGPAWSEAGPG